MDDLKTLAILNEERIISNQSCDDFIKRVRHEAIKRIKKLDKERREMFTNPNKTFDRVMLEAKAEILKEVFDITKEDLK